MNEGFFKQTDINKFGGFKPLPPKLTIQFPLSENKKEKVNINPPSKLEQMLMDVECYPNYFLVKFKNIRTGEYFEFEQIDSFDLDFDHKSVYNFLATCEIITFNGNKYDVPMVRLALKGATNKQLKEASDSLIKSDLQVWNFEKNHGLDEIKIKHIF